MGKRAVTWNFMIAIIIALALIVIFLLFESELFSQYKAKIVEDQCEATVFREYMLKHPSGRYFADSIDCRQISKEIKSDDENQIKMELLKNAHKCWQMFGKSELDLFKDYGVFCHLCYIENFKQKGVAVNDLLQYAKEKVIPGTQVSYWGGTNLYVQPELRTIFRTNESIAVVFSFIRVGSKTDYEKMFSKYSSIAPGLYYVSKAGTELGVLEKAEESQSANQLRQVFDDLGFAPPELQGSGPPWGYFYVGIVGYTPENLAQFACDWTPIQKA